MLAVMLLIGLAVMSLDGCLTRHGEAGTAFSSPEDKRSFRASLQTFDSVLAGRRTYEASRTSPLWSRADARARMILTSAPETFADVARPGELEFRNEGVAAVVSELQRRGRKRCALLGGASLFTEACASRLLDELWVTLEPRAFGEGLRMFEGRVDFSFALVDTERLSQSTLLLKYRRQDDSQTA